MPKVERKIEIESTPDKIFKIVTDGMNTPKWNPSVTAINPIADDKIELETDVGSIKVSKSESEENRSSTWYTEESDMNSIGYIITPKENSTEVAIWTEFDNKKLSKLYKKTADTILEGLKKYVDFLEEGGNPDLYKKWEVMTIP